MGYKLQDRLEVSVYINNQEYPIGDTNLLNALHMATMVQTSLPTLTMSITDVQHKMDDIGLQDGIQIDIKLKPLGDDAVVYSFRKFNHKRIQDGSNFRYLIYGYMDFPVYWATTTCAGITGTSSDVMQKVALKAEMEFDIVPTSDSMLWLPKNIPFRYFCKEVADRGYISDKSCMVLAVDMDGTLRYKDVNNLPKPTTTITAYQASTNAIAATDFSVKISSGLNNAVTGYQNTRYTQSATANTAQEPSSRLTFTPDTTSPQYNTKLNDDIGRGGVRYGPIDHGNVHANYEKASYQNARYKNLFSVGAEVLIANPTKVQLLQQVTYTAQREDASKDSVNSGTYTVAGRAIYIQMSNYAEKLLLLRHGTNETYVSG